jgi:hypothetical protein
MVVLTSIPTLTLAPTLAWALPEKPPKAMVIANRKAVKTLVRDFILKNP